MSLPSSNGDNYIYLPFVHLCAHRERWDAHSPVLWCCCLPTVSGQHPVRLATHSRPGFIPALFFPLAHTSVQEPNCPFSPLPRVLCHVLSQGHHPLPPPPTTPGYRQCLLSACPGASLCTQDKAQPPVGLQAPSRSAAVPLPACTSQVPAACGSPRLSEPRVDLSWWLMCPRAATEAVRGTDGSVLQRFRSTF